MAIKPTATVEINGKKHLLTLGLGFLSLLNKEYTVDYNGVSAGAGLNKALVEIQVGNVQVIRDIILFGTATNRNKPSLSEIEDYIMENMETEEKMVEMFDNFFDIWKKIPGAAFIIEKLDLQNQEMETESSKEEEIDIQISEE